MNSIPEFRRLVEVAKKFTADESAALELRQRAIECGHLVSKGQFSPEVQALILEFQDRVEKAIPEWGTEDPQFTRDDLKAWITNVVSDT